MRVNEIFYSIQGEGAWTGTPMVFVRFSGCNRACDFCDTNHTPFTEMTEAEIAMAVGRWPARHVVITGGEPALQL
ncbi:MAG: 7-carboxy-7-deazaguanine synthase QueE, partial [Muribaculaceae bacterium]|nr:7-carboxy-7-deazaguanine synthase QueE [Muribaculaceae bacterium]